MYTDVPLSEARSSDRIRHGAFEALVQCVHVARARFHPHARCAPTIAPIIPARANPHVALYRAAPCAGVGKLSLVQPWH